ncbi:uncharacterized protein LOC125943408 [Dermacentor silvarum]|uniref:uncharacterized protein LOC125943408 n=1 Tax=Dermacentor silvarum TaxID=543639 RepID=UPI0021016ADF|nr:uncharacterized protein LOC125943408 [Dermacentor silvarum]
MPEVEGEPITQEEASAPGWIEAIRRRATTTTGKPAGARIGEPELRRGLQPPAGSPRCQRIITVSSSTTEVDWIRNNNQQTQGGSAKQKPTPKQPAPSLPTKHLPTTTESPTATPTSADRVAGKGETRGSARSGNLPQHEKDEIRELKRELVFLRKENAEFKALIRNLQQPRERVVEAPTPAALAVEPAPTTSSNANRAAKRRAAEDPADEPVTMSNFMEALARLRADIAADRAADMTPHTLQLTELHARLQILEGQHEADVMLMLKYELMDRITRDTRAILALDLEKAFDRVNHSHILDSIRQAGLGKRFYNYVSSFLRDRTATIQLGSMGSKQFNLGPRGTPQGAVISPFLFNLSMRGLLRQLSQIEGISHAFYADDITVWSTRGTDGHIEERLQEAVSTVQTFLRQAGLSLSAEK